MNKSSARRLPLLANIASVGGYSGYCFEQYTIGLISQSTTIHLQDNSIIAAVNSQAHGHSSRLESDPAVRKVVRPETCADRYSSAAALDCLKMFDLCVRSSGLSTLLGVLPVATA